MKHTQGPWYSHGLAIGTEPKDKMTGLHIWIAQAVCGTPSQEDYANINLMAAAPELYNLLAALTFPEKILSEEECDLLFCKAVELFDKIGEIQ